MDSRIELDQLPGAFRKDIERAVEILKTSGCEEIYLFGSAAEDRLTENSDIDIAVRGCPVGSFFKLQGKLLVELDHSVDLVDLDKDPDLADFLDREALLVHVG